MLEARGGNWDFFHRSECFCNPFTWFIYLFIANNNYTVVKSIHSQEIQMYWQLHFSNGNLP